MRDATLRMYRWLLKLYPAAFREEYASELERQVRDDLAESRGFAAVLVLWARLLLDLAVSVPAQIARQAWQDSRHALRQWARRPLNTGFAILALAIGIGANIGVFSVVNALLLRPLPFRDPDRLAQLAIFSTPHSSASQFDNWRIHSAYLEDAALVEQGDVNLDAAGEPVRAHITQSSWNFFALLGVQPMLGRAFEPGEDTAGANNVAVIGYGLWQQLFGGDPRALGSEIRIDGASLTVVGIAPPGFDYPGSSVLWRPGVLTPGNNGWTTIARLKPGLTWGRARSAFAVEAERLAPNRRRADKLARPAVLLPLQEALSGDPAVPPHSPPSAKTASLILMAGALLILLIACSNLANLLLARAADRATELSVRSALGASRARLCQQLLTESMLLAGAASLAGLVLARWTAAIAARLQPAPLSAQAYSLLDVRVLCFAIILTFSCGLLFGVAPALYAARSHTFGIRGSNTAAGSRRIHEVLIAVQVALTVVLLAGAVTLRGAFMHLVGLDRGFDQHGVVTVSLSVTGTPEQGDPALAYLSEVLRRVKRLPGVLGAGATEFLPLAPDHGYVGGPVTVSGRPADRNAMLVAVLPGYFQAVGGRFLAGREFTDQEIQSDAQVVVINEALARQFGAPADVVGQQLRTGRSGTGSARTIIGVVQDMVYLGDYNHNQRFVPDHRPGSFGVTVVARVSGKAGNYLGLVRGAVKSVDPHVPVFDVKTMDQRLDEALVGPQFFSTAGLFFGGFALLLAVIGIYGVVSYAVSRRTHEMGVRLALGTTPDRMRTAILGQGLMIVAFGALPGAVCAMLTGRFIQSLIDGAPPVSLAVCGSAFLVIAATAASSIWIATRRIARLDIMDVLRAE
jgi:predicted permease